MQRTAVTTTALLAVLLTFASACRTSSVGPADPDPSQAPIPAELARPFWLNYQETAELDGGTLRVRFDDLLEDSRCPLDVVCVWEGRGRVGLNVWASGNPPASLQLTIPGSQGSTDPREHAVKFAGYTFSLHDLAPQPDSRMSPTREEYSALLFIETPASSGP